MMKYLLIKGVSGTVFGITRIAFLSLQIVTVHGFDCRENFFILQMMGKDRYVVATTSTTLILADTETAKSSEIDWHSGGNEKSVHFSIFTRLQLSFIC